MVESNSKVPEDVTLSTKLKESYENLQPLEMHGWFRGINKVGQKANWIQIIQIDDSDYSKQLLARTELAKSLSHSAIYPLTGSSFNTIEGHIASVEFYCLEPESTLSQDLQNEKTFNGIEIINIARSISSGLSYAKTTKKLSHGNLKSEWLFRSKNSYLIAGWCNIDSRYLDSLLKNSMRIFKSLDKSGFDEKMESSQVTVECDFSQDVLSLGLLILEVAGIDTTDLRSHGIQALKYPQYVSWGISQLSKKKIHPDFVKLVDRMLQPNPLVRPKIEEILQSLDILVGIEYEENSYGVSSSIIDTSSRLEFSRLDCSEGKFGINHSYVSGIPSKILSPSYTSTYINNNFFAECLEIHLNRLKVLKDKKDKPDRETLIEISDLSYSIGTAYIALELPSQSLPHFQNSLSMRIKLFGRDSEQVYETYLQIGSALRKDKQLVQAQKYLETGLAICKRVHGKEGYPLVQYHSELADLFKDLMKIEKKNKRKKLLENIRQIQLAALKIREIWVSPMSTELAISYFEVGLAVFMKEPLPKGKGKSLPYFQKAIDIWQTSESKNASNISRALMLMGCVYRQLGVDLNNALQLFNRAYDIIYKYFGPLHRKIALPLYYTGELYSRCLSKPQEALYYLESAAEVLKKAGSKDNITHALNTYCLAECYKNLEEYSKAEVTFKRARELILVTFGKEHHYLKKCDEKLKIIMKEASKKGK